MRLPTEGTSVGATLRDKAHQPIKTSRLLHPKVSYPSFGIEDSHAVRTNEVEIRLFCSLSEQALKPSPFLSISLGKACGKEMSSTYFFTNAIL
jgi:hypothetical protein